jgi:hypothetical protein
MTPPAFVAPPMRQSKIKNAINDTDELTRILGPIAFIAKKNLP